MAVPECLRCGTCCFSTSEEYVRVTGEDFARLGELAGALVAWSGNRAFMQMRDGHCAALQLDPAAGAFVCTVYARRPQICRDLERGSPECEGELATKGDRPPRALRGG
jgi:Fe-S-cluster containining protein